MSLLQALVWLNVQYDFFASAINTISHTVTVAACSCRCGGIQPRVRHGLAAWVSKSMISGRLLRSGHWSPSNKVIFSTIKVKKPAAYSHGWPPEGLCPQSRAMPLHLGDNSVFRPRQQARHPYQERRALGPRVSDERNDAVGTRKLTCLQIRLINLIWHTVAPA